MAEPTDPPPGPAATGITAMPAMPSADKPEAYRPIALLAIIGFTLACLYAVVILGGAIISLAISRQPLLLPILIVVVVPGVAAVLCLLARNQILSAEGTLAGLPLTKWGLALCLVPFLGYVAYYAATALAVRQQAMTFADQFFDTLKRGETDRAFLLTRPPSARPPEGPTQRDAIENELNDSPDVVKIPGAYSDFQQKDFVRVIQKTGDRSKVELLSVGDWDWKEGGFKVPLRYKITTDLMSFELLITVHSREGRGKDPKGRVEAKGRQWRVVWPDETRLESVPELTPEGEALMKRYASARLFAQEWAFKVNAGDAWDLVYLDFLPLEQRKSTYELLNSHAPAMAATGAALILVGHKDCLAYLKDKTDRVRADWVRTDKGQFWADQKVREEMSAAVRKVFQQGREDRQPVISLPSLGVPLWSTDEGGKFRFGIDFQIIRLTKYKAEGLLFVEADAAKDNPDPSDWRIDHVEMLRARSAPNLPVGMEVPPG